MYAATFTGASYSPATDDSSIEVFESLEDAYDSLMNRWSSNGAVHVTTYTLDGKHHTNFWPTVGEDDHLSLYAIEDLPLNSPEDVREAWVAEALSAVLEGYSDYRLILSAERAGEMAVLVTTH